MGTAERRKQLLRILCRRKYDTMSNLAFELGVSPRTIRRDVEILSLTEPLYTQTGRHGGGVYIDKDYRMDRMYFEPEQQTVLQSVVQYISSIDPSPFSPKEMNILRSILIEYSKPTTKNNRHQRV